MEEICGGSGPGSYQTRGKGRRFPLFARAARYRLVPAAARAGVPVEVVVAARAGVRLILAQFVAEAGTSSPVARAVAEPLDRCDACTHGEDVGREVVQVEALPAMHWAHAARASIYAVPQIRQGYAPSPL